MCNKHVHADLMLQYAQDAQETDKPWLNWEFRATSKLWIDCNNSPSWDVVLEYRRKRKTHVVNGKEVAAPLDKVVEGQHVFTWEISVLRDTPLVNKTLVHKPYKWHSLINYGLLFESSEAALENFYALFPPRNLKA